LITSFNDELIVLGYAVSNKEALDRLLSEVTEDHFTEPETAAMYNGIIQIIEQGARLTFPNVGRAIGNSEIVQDAMIASAKALMPEPHFKMLHECYQRRGYRQLAQQISRLTALETFDIKAAEKMITEYMPGNPAESAKRHFIEMDEAVDKFLDKFREARKNPGKINGLSLTYELPNGQKVGFKGIDATLMGLKGGDAIMFAAESGHGKTALAMNLTRILSYHNGKRTHYLNTEMAEAEMIQRWAAQGALIPYRMIEDGSTSDYDAGRIEKWAAEFRKAPLTISQISSLNIDLTYGIAKRAVKKYGGLDCLIVDYIGRMDIEHGKGMQEWQIMYENTKKLKELARDLNIPIIILAQLTQEGNLEGARKMRNELDALFYFRPTVVGENGEGRDKKKVFSDTDYVLTKEKVRRNGTSNAISIKFDKEYLFIREV
jgi:replicative DNA helicase